MLTRVDTVRAGACPHVEGFAAYWILNLVGYGLANLNPDGQAAAGDVSLMAANCSADSRCVGFSSTGKTQRVVGCQDAYQERATDGACALGCTRVPLLQNDGWRIPVVR